MITGTNLKVITYLYFDLLVEENKLKRKTSVTLSDKYKRLNIIQSKKKELSQRYTELTNKPIPTKSAPWRTVK